MSVLTPPTTVDLPTTKATRRFSPITFIGSLTTRSVKGK